MQYSVRGIKMIENFKILKKYRKYLTSQQKKTFKGQILAGDAIGFKKGLKKVLERYKND